MHISIKTLEGETHTFEIDESVTVLELKERIFERTGMPVDKQQLIFDGKPITDTLPFEELRNNGGDIALHPVQIKNNNNHFFAKPFDWGRVWKYTANGAAAGVFTGLVVGGVAGAIIGGLTGASGTLVHGHVFFGAAGAVAGAFLTGFLGMFVGAIAGALIGAMIGFGVGVGAELWRLYNESCDQVEPGQGLSLQR